MSSKRFLTLSELRSLPPFDSFSRGHLGRMARTGALPIRAIRVGPKKFVVEARAVHDWLATQIGRAPSPRAA